MPRVGAEKELSSPRTGFSAGLLLRQRSAGLVRPVSAWVLLRGSQGWWPREYSMQELQVSRHSTTHLTRLRVVLWNDSEGARGSRSLLLPLGRPAQAPRHRRTCLHQMESDPSTIDKFAPKTVIICVSGMGSLVTLTRTVIPSRQFTRAQEFGVDVGLVGQFCALVP